MSKVLFLYLNAFSVTGGIEKFNSSFLKALQELSNEETMNAQAFSMYDTETNEKYFSKTKFKGFSGNRILFVLSSVLHSFRNNTIILGHINLALVGWLIKRINPKTKIILIAHGIEVWETQTSLKKRILKEADFIWCVSNFTKNKMITSNSFVNPNKAFIFPNTIDDYFIFPLNFSKPDYLLNRYKISPTKKIILTITRLSSSEKYKGYENVLQGLSKINNSSIKYILGGKADEKEKQRVETLIKEYGLEDKVSLIGFIKDEELTDHYLLADAFVMPSKGEGFGIVFIEAMACGCKVIAGNKDGSVDALQNGALGKLINPDSVEELETAIKETLADTQHNALELQQKVMTAFGFPVFKNRLKQYLSA
ncbi:MAG: glycosyltransferase family 4 protein [Chitinophagaceae bacterium]|nr:glycosyltransferase family 4 protein [Chitinophagaceae bacterium]MCW5905683.1 glycosyltransferase family 4 protein [Chitinophagaceae bacterium]